MLFSQRSLDFKSLCGCIWQMADLYGLRAVPVGGGEIRGAGNLWICPEVRQHLPLPS